MSVHPEEQNRMPTGIPTLTHVLPAQQVPPELGARLAQLTQEKAAWFALAGPLCQRLQTELEGLIRPLVQDVLEQQWQKKVLERQSKGGADDTQSL